MGKKKFVNEKDQYTGERKGQELKRNKRLCHHVCSLQSIIRNRGWIKIYMFVLLNLHVKQVRYSFCFLFVCFCFCILMRDFVVSLLHHDQILSLLDKSIRDDRRY